MEKMYKMLAITACILATALLTGCDEIAGSSNGSSYSSDVSDSGIILASSETSAHVHNPEPATMALLGSGLAAYALLRRKKK